MVFGLGENKVYKDMDLNNYQITEFSKLYLSFLVLKGYFGTLYNNSDMTEIYRNIALKPFTKWYKKNDKLYEFTNFGNDVTISIKLLNEIKKKKEEYVTINKNKKIQLKDMKISIYHNTENLEKLILEIESVLKLIKGTFDLELMGKTYKYTPESRKMICNNISSIDNFDCRKIEGEVSKSFDYVEAILKTLISSNLK